MPALVLVMRILDVIFGIFESSVGVTTRQMQLCNSECCLSAFDNALAEESTTALLINLTSSRYKEKFKVHKYLI